MPPGGISSIILVTHAIDASATRDWGGQSQFVLGFDREQTYFSESRRFIKRVYCVLYVQCNLFNQDRQVSALNCPD